MSSTSRAKKRSTVNAARGSVAAATIAARTTHRRIIRLMISAPMPLPAGGCRRQRTRLPARIRPGHDLDVPGVVDLRGGHRRDHDAELGKLHAEGDGQAHPVALLETGR